MKNKFIYVNLLPKYVSNKTLSNVIFTIGILSTILFVGFYSNYLPYVSSVKNLARSEYEYYISKQYKDYY